MSTGPKDLALISFHYIYLWHSQFTLTWPEEPGFIGLNKSIGGIQP
jgi:hypothetical protein